MRESCSNWSLQTPKLVHYHKNESSEEGKVRGTGKEPASVWINKASWEARKIGFRRVV